MLKDPDFNQKRPEQINSRKQIKQHKSDCLEMEACELNPRQAFSTYSKEMVIWYIQAPENLSDYTGASYSQILQLIEVQYNNCYSLSSEA